MSSTKRKQRKAHPLGLTGDQEVAYEACLSLGFVAALVKQARQPARTDLPPESGFQPMWALRELRSARESHATWAEGLRSGAAHLGALAERIRRACIATVEPVRIGKAVLADSAVAAISGACSFVLHLVRERGCDDEFLAAMDRLAAGIRSHLDEVEARASFEIDRLGVRELGSTAEAVLRVLPPSDGKALRTREDVARALRWATMPDLSTISRAMTELRGLELADEHVYRRTPEGDRRVRR